MPNSVQAMRPKQFPYVAWLHSTGFLQTMTHHFVSVLRYCRLLRTAVLWLCVSPVVLVCVIAPTAACSTITITVVVLFMVVMSKMMMLIVVVALLKGDHDVGHRLLHHHKVHEQCLACFSIIRQQQHSC